MNTRNIEIYVVRDSKGNAWVYTTEVAAKTAFKSVTKEAEESYSKSLRITADCIGGNHFYIFDKDEPQKGFIFEAWYGRAMNGGINLKSKDFLPLIAYTNNIEITA